LVSRHCRRRSDARALLRPPELPDCAPQPASARRARPMSPGGDGNCRGDRPARRQSAAISRRVVALRQSAPPVASETPAPAIGGSRGGQTLEELEAGRSAGRAENGDTKTNDPTRPPAVAKGGERVFRARRRWPLYPRPRVIRASLKSALERQLSRCKAGTASARGLCDAAGIPPPAAARCSRMCGSGIVERRHHQLRLPIRPIPSRVQERRAKRACGLALRRAMVRPATSAGGGGH